MISRVIHVENQLGLHARAAAKLVKLTAGFQSDIKLSLSNSNQKIDAKSILGILLLAATKGTELEVIIDGEDEEAAMEEIVNLFRNRFGEEQ